MYIPGVPLSLDVFSFSSFFFSGGLSHTFQKFGIKTAPHVYLVPRGIAIPAQPTLSTYEFTRGMSNPDGNLDDFLHDFNAITGSEVKLMPFWCVRACVCVFAPRRTAYRQEGVVLTFVEGLRGVSVCGWVGHSDFTRGTNRSDRSYRVRLDRSYLVPLCP